MRNVWQELSGLLLPAACAGCGRPRTELCASCGAALLAGPARRVLPSPTPPGLPAVWAGPADQYAGRAVVVAHKERGGLGVGGGGGRA
ncbi:ComF family protein, partial [Streptomyces globisporus]